MPVFEASVLLTREPAEVFARFVEPSWLIATAPPELSLRLVEAPPALSLGARTTVAGRRWGIPHRVTLEVTAFEADRLLVEEQREGPFKRWVVTHRFEPAGGGTRLTARVEFEPPGGLLGLTVTEAFVRREIETLWAYRAERLRLHFGT
jgi:ligand-binding SRPBCC domain-containing protein